MIFCWASSSSWLAFRSLFLLSACTQQKKEMANEKIIRGKIFKLWIKSCGIIEARRRRKSFSELWSRYRIGNILIYSRNRKKKKSFLLHSHCELLELGTRKIEKMIKIIKAHHCACVLREGKFWNFFLSRARMKNEMLIRLERRGFPASRIHQWDFQWNFPKWYGDAMMTGERRKKGKTWMDGENCINTWEMCVGLNTYEGK